MLVLLLAVQYCREAPCRTEPHLPFIGAVGAPKASSIPLALGIMHNKPLVCN